MNEINWTSLFKHYKGQWVALGDDEVSVIASSDSVKKVLLLSAKKGLKNPILFKVPKKNVTYVGHAWGEGIQLQKS